MNVNHMGIGTKKDCTVKSYKHSAVWVVFVLTVLSMSTVDGIFGRMALIVLRLAIQGKRSGF